MDGTPEPVIMWEKDSQNLTQDNNIAIKNSTFTSVLNIKKVSKNDEGKYSCKASNGFGQPIEAHGFLVVKDRRKCCGVFSPWSETFYETIFISFYRDSSHYKDDTKPNSICW